MNKKNQLGLPQSSIDSFQLLCSAGFITVSVATNLKKMIGLRNIAVHDYKELNIDIVEAVN
ncbi:type VII toxin-antitoxin system HepT family RNase toxin [Colwellia sp. 12G3]|uniref:type VII toxin-antitoxin system HepT family RNase toxin n=1 Tax=Colwellia sp. 12G3 TaxID=2058299 RepID=UPI0022B7DEAA|nr:HepT-like ribonuclease domain-containing protein [Colwellia sp. 12G3]